MINSYRQRPDLEPGHQLGHVFAVSLGLDLTLLLRPLADHGLDHVVTLLGALVSKKIYEKNMRMKLLFGLF